MRILTNDTCPSCFQGELRNGICPVCGFQAAQETGHPRALPWFQILHNGTYLTGKVLGEGGFGITYIAKSGNTDALCCIKEYMPDDLECIRNADGTLTVPENNRQEYMRGMKRFLEEAKVLQQFRICPEIVDIRDYFEQNGTAYFVMEYLDGCNLRAYQRNHANDREAIKRTALQAVRAAGRALEQVHKVGFIHGDISPENIMITKNGEIKLIDFGTARLYGSPTSSQEGKIFVKTGYAPYEQYMSNGRIGPWSDVYALAATYYAIVTGRKIPDARERIKKDTFVRLYDLCPDITKEISNVIEEALASDYRERYESMRQFLDALAKAAPEENRRDSPDKTEEDPEPAQPSVPSVEKTGSQKKGFWGFWKKKEQREKSFYLELKTDTGLTRSWKIQPDQWLTVGRQLECQLVLPPDSRLSRRHCLICYSSRENCLWVTDESTYGTYRAGGIRMSPGIPCKVRIGEVFYLAVPEFQICMVEDRNS